MAITNGVNYNQNRGLIISTDEKNRLIVSTGGTTTITGDTSGSTVFEVVGTNGQLLEVTDSSSGLIFGVNNASGNTMFSVYNNNGSDTVIIKDNQVVISGATDPIKIIGIQSGNTDTLFVTIDEQGVIHSSPQGPEGTSGTSGLSGISGESGISGISGESGLSGESGISGISGESGLSGISGISGLSGLSGDSGLSGTSGLSGISGISGLSGDSGISGISGLEGTSGLSGISGESGISGLSGDSGISGISGISGQSGTSGISGLSGISGTLGISGISGISGYSGWSGESGISGTEGPLSGSYGDPNGNVNGTYINQLYFDANGSVWQWNGGNWIQVYNISGISGWSGESGLSGESGISGISGLSGTSGISGISGIGFNTVQNPALYRVLTSDGTTNGAIAQSGLTYQNQVLYITGATQYYTGFTGATNVGQLNWDDGEGTLTLGLRGGNVELQLGKENVVLVNNGESTTLLEGEVVYVSGSQGNRPKVKRALATSDGYSVTTLGIVTETITAGNEGFVTTFGLVNNLDTSSFSGGTALWLSPTTPGGLTSTKPQAPNHTVLIGYAVRIDNNVGSIFVHISNGWEIEELHNVRVTGVTEGDLLVYNNSQSIWENTKNLNGTYTLDKLKIDNIQTGSTSNEILTINTSTKEVESRSSYRSVTYSELRSMMSGGTLIPGQKYIINDFRTIHRIVNTSVINTGSTEPLVVTAESGSTISNQVFSPSFPQDIIVYDVYNNLAEDNVTPRPGKIIYRQDTTFKVITHYDFRQVKFRRWALNTASYSLWGSGTTYTANQVVLDSSNALWLSNSDENTNNTPSLTANSYWTQIWDNVASGNKKYWLTNSGNTSMGLYTLTPNTSDFKDYFTFHNLDTDSFYQFNTNPNAGVYHFDLGPSTSPNGNDLSTTGTGYNNVIILATSATTIQYNIFKGANINKTIFLDNTNSFFYGNVFDTISTTMFFRGGGFYLKFPPLITQNIFGIGPSYISGNFRTSIFSNSLSGIRSDGGSTTDMRILNSSLNVIFSGVISRAVIGIGNQRLHVNRIADLRILGNATHSGNVIGPIDTNNSTTSGNYRLINSSINGGGNILTARIPLTFTGAAGSGAVGSLTLERITIPSNWTVDTVTFRGTSLVYGSGATLNFGFTGNSTAILDNSSGLISSTNDFFKVRPTTTPSSSMTALITGSVVGNSITSGTAILTITFIKS